VPVRGDPDGPRADLSQDWIDSRNATYSSFVPTTAESQRILRAADLRVTRPRVAVLAAVHDNPHADTATIAGAVRGELADVSTQAIYDVLRALTEAGLVRRIQPAGSAARYEARVGDNHHHLICRSCAAIVDVDCAAGESPCLDAHDDNGYVIDEAEVVYWGLCPTCSKTESPN
jgi:Fur family ferric uptake transcriptional regulator